MHNVIWYAEPPQNDNPYLSRQIAAADYLMLERGATDPGLVKGTGRFGMRTFLDYIDSAHALGANVLLLDETAPRSTNSGSISLQACSRVTATISVSTEDWDLISPDGFWSGFTTNLGRALGPRYVDENLIRRDFTDGIVLLNEPGRDPVTIRLDAPMRTPSGQPSPRSRSATVKRSCSHILAGHRHRRPQRQPGLGPPGGGPHRHPRVPVDRASRAPSCWRRTRTVQPRHGLLLPPEAVRIRRTRGWLAHGSRTHTLSSQTSGGATGVLGRGPRMMVPRIAHPALSSGPESC